MFHLLFICLFNPFIVLLSHNAYQQLYISHRFISPFFFIQTICLYKSIHQFISIHLFIRLFNTSCVVLLCHIKNYIRVTDSLVHLFFVVFDHMGLQLIRINIFLDVTSLHKVCLLGLFCVQPALDHLPHSWREEKRSSCLHQNCSITHHGHIVIKRMGTNSQKHRHRQSREKIGLGECVISETPLANFIISTVIGSG